MNCSQCQFESPASMKFCVECGHKLLIRCGQCGTELLPSFKFCGECGNSVASSCGAEVATPAGNLPLGASLPSASSPLSGAAPPVVLKEGERKQVSVLFCELSAVGQEVESPDVLHEVLSGFFALAQEEVQRFGGTVNRFLGQGFMALFGAPVAYEDHPKRAILAAQGLRQKVVDAHASAGEWSVRMGIDTGTVVVGGVGGMAVGEATEFAALLQNQASVGEILVSSAAARLMRGGAQLARRQAVDSAGAALEVWKAPGDLAAAPVSIFAQAGATPFVGREYELSVLEGLRDKAREGQGQVVALSGEAGSGKSRLLHELFLRTLHSKEGTSYLRGQCVSYGAGVPYLPLIDMVRKASRISGADDAKEVQRKLRSSLQSVGTDPAETLPFLLRLLGVKEGTESLDELEPQAIQARTFAAMRRMLLNAANKSLVVLEIEDLQWIDATSAEFLDSLIEVLAPAGLMVVLAFRSGYQPRWLEKSYTTLLNTGQLSSTESRNLVAALFERAELEEEPPEDILEKAEGNPFFLEELARALIEGASGELQGQETVPSTVQGILMARIDRLPENHKRLLRTASVLGRELSLELLEKIWQESDDLEGLLDDLQRWELIYKAPSEDRPTFFFRQALTQEVTYQSLLATQRQQLHGLAAAALEKLYDQRLEDVFDRLIYHYPKSGQPEKTLHYLTLFASRAAEGYAHSEAAQALREALGQVEFLPEEEKDRRLIEVLLQLAESLLPLASFSETHELFQNYLARLESLADPKLAGLYYFWLAHTFTYLGFQEETQTYAEKSIDAAKKCGDETTEGKARYVLGRDGFWSGQFQAGVDNSLQAVVLLERNDEPWWQGQAYWVAGFNLYALGRFQQAIEVLEHAFALGEALDDYRLDTSWSLGYFYASLGEAEAGIEQCQHGLERSQDPLNSAVSTGFLGHALLQEGRDVAQAIENLERATGLMADAGMQQLEGWFSSILGEALLADGRVEEARTAAARGLEASQAAKFWYGVGLAQESLGRIALTASDFEAAENNLGLARQRFEELNVPFEVARIDLELGHLARSVGKPDEASEMFLLAQEAFENLSVPFWIEKATAAAVL